MTLASKGAKSHSPPTEAWGFGTKEDVVQALHVEQAAIVSSNMIAWVHPPPANWAVDQAHQHDREHWDDVD
jgi:hypothetical protein